MRAISILFFVLFWSGHILAADNSKNHYTCHIFEPNMGVVVVRVNPENQIHEHVLADGVHALEVQWWHWTLNLSLRVKGQIRETLGAASASELRLRSHDPEVSAHCLRE